MSAKINNGHR